MGSTMLLKALPFTLCYTLVPLIVLAALYGGWWIAAPFAWGWFCVAVLDRVMGLNTDNMDPGTEDSVLFWHKLVVWCWVPTQAILVVWCIWQVTEPGLLSMWEQVGVMASLAAASGGIGINFAHELVHQRSRWERYAGESLLVSVAYGPFATEHVFGHHVTVGTPADPVSARKGEVFYVFLIRAIVGTFTSAWALDRDRLARRGLSVWHRTNPFWRYMIGMAIYVLIAYAIAGWWGVALYFMQSFVAIFQLEAVNYVEHYGLTRKFLDNGKFERVQPRHSWNAAHTVSNWMLINLQRHSDHHYRPDRRFPLLQHHSWESAPQLPMSYPVMISAALTPPIWFWMMDRRVDRWRAKFYPEIADWSAYENGTIGQEGRAAATAQPA